MGRPGVIEIFSVCYVKSITKLKNLHIEIKCDPRAAQRTETNHFYVDRHRLIVIEFISHPLKSLI